MAGTAWQPLIGVMSKTALQLEPNAHEIVCFFAPLRKGIAQANAQISITRSPDFLEDGTPDRRFAIAISGTHLGGKPWRWVVEKFAEHNYEYQVVDGAHLFHGIALEHEKLPYFLTIAFDAMGEAFGLSGNWTIETLPHGPLEEAMLFNYSFVLKGGSVFRLRGTSTRIPFNSTHFWSFLGLKRIKEDQG